MADTVHPRTCARKGKKQDRIRRAERRAREQDQAAAWFARWSACAQAFGEETLNQEISTLLGRPAHQWGDRSEQVSIEAQCNRCHRSWRSWFHRNGSYPRTLDLADLVVSVRVPRLRCACGGGVDLSFSLFAPYQRLSPELAARLREGIALGLTLQQVGRQQRPVQGGPLAKSTINRQVHALGPLVAAFHQEPLARIPPVVLLDGIWTKMLVPTGARFVDTRHRERPKMRRQKVGLLVAYGVDPTTGEGWVLDWEQAEQEDEASWARLLERLRQRGLTVGNGLKLVGSDGGEGLRAALAAVDLGPGLRHQRCIFHKLRNIAQAVKAAGGATREERRAQRRQVVEEAAAIYQAEERATILERRDAFVTKWQESEPHAVATLLRDFDQTLVYLEVPDTGGAPWNARFLRTTSVLERLNRTLRRMVRQVVLFHAKVGLEARVYLTLCEAGAIPIPAGGDWLEIVEDALAAA